ncbi:MAG: GHKL domain-containing protein [Prolixibacteraceae bacterium]|nr:GHKL domain-containing protein [Prolixibacteraceae bacterium]
MKTYFATPERADSEKLKSQNTLFRNNETLVSITNSVSQMLVVLNAERQIIYANNQFCELLSLSNCTYLGKRVGEALNCIHSNQTTGGCGTTEFCSKCGAVNAMLEAQLGVKSIKECRISTFNTEALDLKVSATPYTLNEELFTIFVISDVSNEKRRQILERVFFHDVLNSAGGISGLSLMLKEVENPKEITELADLIHSSSEQLINEITAQRQLNAAEHSELELALMHVESIFILQQIADIYSRHEISNGKYISINKMSENFMFETDPTLLKRVLGNMLKNALEASLLNSKVTLSVVKNESSALFSVHNNSYIDADTQLQLFKRSFTTKGVGRGLGTYSMKLFGEKYLKGSVWFESKQDLGTTFYIELPIT